MFITPSIVRKLTRHELSALLGSRRARSPAQGARCTQCGQNLFAKPIRQSTAGPELAIRNVHYTPAPLAVIGQGEYAREIDAVPGPKLKFTFLAWRFTIAFLIAALVLMLCIVLIH